MPRYAITATYSAPSALTPEAHQALGATLEAAAVASLRVLDGERSGLACPACAEALRKAGWAVVRRGRGGDGT